VKRCVFFDRDGIVNESPGPGRWVLTPEEFRLRPGFPPLLSRVRRLGFEAVLATNQQAVGLGLISREMLERIHWQLREQLRTAYGLDLEDILVCPHRADEGCLCRKPKPGLLLEAAWRHGYDLSACWMIGDAERDVEAGRAAGCRTVLIAPGEPVSVADVVASSLEDLDKRIAEGRLIL